VTKEQHNLAAILTLRDEFRRRGTRVVAITIARGGSNRLPRKNTLPFAGRPLVEWSIIQSLCSHLVTDTYLCTDDEEIAGVGRKAGAKIVWRYESTPCGVTANVTFSHAIRQIREWQPIDIAITILPTSPLRQPWDFDENIRLYQEVRQAYRECWVVGGLSRQMETVVHRKIDAIRSTVIIGDKRWNYLDGAGATWTVCDPDGYLAMTERSPKFDKEIDEKFVEVARQSTEIPQGDVTYYYGLEPWQRFDLDLPEQLGLMEDVMRRYILTEPDVYERYKAAGKTAEKESVTI